MQRAAAPPPLASAANSARTERNPCGYLPRRRGLSPHPVDHRRPSGRRAPPALAERIDGALSGSGIEWELLIVDDDSGDGSETVATELAHRLRSVAIVVPGCGSRSVPGRHRRHPAVPVRPAGGDGTRTCRTLPNASSTCLPPLTPVATWSSAAATSGRHRGQLLEPLSGAEFPAGDMAGAPPGRLRRSHVGLLRHPPQRPSRGPTSRPMGYKIALELMVRGRLRVREIPIDFRDRSVGSSKMNWRQQVRFLRHLSRLYNHRFGTLARVPSSARWGPAAWWSILPATWACSGRGRAPAGALPVVLARGGLELGTQPWIHLQRTGAPAASRTVGAVHGKQPHRPRDERRQLRAPDQLRRPSSTATAWRRSFAASSWAAW